MDDILVVGGQGIGLLDGHADGAEGAGLGLQREHGGLTRGDGDRLGGGGGLGTVRIQKEGEGAVRLKGGDLPRHGEGVSQVGITHRGEAVVLYGGGHVDHLHILGGRIVTVGEQDSLQPAVLVEVALGDTDGIGRIQGIVGGGQLLQKEQELLLVLGALTDDPRGVPCEDQGEEAAVHGVRHPRADGILGGLKAGCGGASLLGGESRLHAHTARAVQNEAVLLSGVGNRDDGVGDGHGDEGHGQDLQDQADDARQGAGAALPLEEFFRESPEVGGGHRLLGVFAFDDVDQDQNGNSDQAE